ncbi:MAG: bifunctional DNA-binding transcriptional regulator/O6-methylguanine-DNA methyltransferase Ada [Acidobacteria bacterium]|nr:bifunctional DNA-binding transcriptional regulator/O6-methylguanine-DNA methyltransferase Ada [Acidobacteriota bacterium]
MALVPTNRSFRSSPDARWRAVLARDARLDGRFVFAVRSTGIYCRPSCPSRRPRREQVVFFARPEAAERVGFRACRRCRPSDTSDGNPQVELVRQVCRTIDLHLRESSEGMPRLAALSAQIGVSPQHLQRTFKRLIGISPRQYADARRLGTLKAQLQKGDDVTTALYEAGYGSSSRLYEQADSQLGMTPATYRRGGQGMNIAYTIVNSPLGRLLVAATRKGISALYLSDSDTRMESALRREYPNAGIHRDQNGMGNWVRMILKHLEGTEPRLDLPVDVQATAFQRRVWEELRSIPFGSTRSYSQIARSIGRPRANRAVARACATNPVSVVIPCHRVVREDGQLGGYRWGLHRKQTLLAQEKRMASRKH